MMPTSAIVAKHHQQTIGGDGASLVHIIPRSRLAANVQQ